jgi:hypothetical protein
MAMVPRFDSEAREKLERELMALDGVLHAAIDIRSGSDVWVVRDPGYDSSPVDLAVRNRLAQLGHDPSGLFVRVTLPSVSGPRRRVRFERLEREEETERVAITVALEWAGTVYTGDASGERGSSIELKTAARATIRALETLIGESLEVRITGVKRIHAFDADLMVASIYRDAGVQQRLVGAVVVSENPLNGAVMAVLSALNRPLGNYLHKSN